MRTCEMWQALGIMLGEEHRLAREDTVRIEDIGAESARRP